MNSFIDLMMEHSTLTTIIVIAIGVTLANVMHLVNKREAKKQREHFLRK